MVIRTVIGWYKHNQNAAGFPAVAAEGDYIDARKNHRKLARQFAAESIVLLNTNGALPISNPKKIAIFGYHAGSATIGPSTPMNVEGSESVYRSAEEGSESLGCRRPGVEGRERRLYALGGGEQQGLEGVGCLDDLHSRLRFRC